MDHRVDERCEKCGRRATVYRYQDSYGFGEAWLCASCVEDRSREED